MKKDLVTLWNAFETIKDPRNPSGRRYSLGSILRMMVCGLLCGCNHTAEIARWSNRLTKKQLEQLGFTRYRVPSEGALSNLFRGIDMSQMESVMGSWQLNGSKKKRSSEHVAIDGKVLKGSVHNTSKAIHLLAAFAIPQRKVMNQSKVDSSTNEITTAIKVLKEMKLEGVIITGDAIFAQKKYVS